MCLRFGIKSLILVFAVTSSLATVAFADPCSDMAAKSSVAKNEGVKLSNFDWEAAAQSKVIFIGDEHSYSNTDIFSSIGKLVQTAAPTKKLCLFLEFPSSLSVEKFRQILMRKTGSPGNDRFRAYYLKILNDFQDMGYTPYLVDDPKHLQNLDESVHDRNIAIAKAIVQLSEKSCDLSVMVVGKEHIAPKRPLDNDLEGLLGGFIPVVTINAEASRDRVPYEQLASWEKICPSKAYIPSQPVIFPNKDIATLPIYPNFSDYSVYGDFNFTVLYP